MMKYPEEIFDRYLFYPSCFLASSLYHFYERLLSSEYLLYHAHCNIAATILNSIFFAPIA